MSLTHREIRDRFKRFYEKNGHAEVPPIPLVPQNDPTTLFTGSGMQQFVPNLLGEPHPQGIRLYNIQPCFRAQDIEEIGDNRHTTFFEMIGNWSLGDYFKKEQLTRLFHFLTDSKEGLGLDSEKLYVTVFEGYKTIPKDEESYLIWKNLGISDERIRFYGPEKNWWSRAGVPDNMPAGEPGGPDSEIFYDFGPGLKIHENSVFKNEECHPNCDCGRFMEVCNSVFMQYLKKEDGTFQELPKKNVDFGGGLERFIAAVNNNPDIFEADVFKNIIKAIEEVTGEDYSDNKNKKYMRVIADHMKVATFLITAGVQPSNKERGYVLRRLIRRSVVKMHGLNQEASLHSANYITICKKVVEMYKDIYLSEKVTHDLQIHIGNEVDRFTKSLNEGLKEIKKVEKIDGKIAFNLYQSLGFPLELTEELFEEKGQKINKKEFRDEFEKHKNLSRTASSGMFKGGLADNSEQVLKYHTATHLLHQALFDVLGNEVKQEGSNITGDRLRFDFTASRKPTDEDIKKITEIINEKIKAKLPVQFEIMPKEKAYKVGARSFFREKYPENVKVYFIGKDISSAYSKEFCGGPHVKNTGEIGSLQLYKTEKIGSNIFRIYAK